MIDEKKEARKRAMGTFLIRKWMRSQPKDKMRKLTEKEQYDKERIIRELELQLEEFPEVQTIIKNLKK